MQLALGLGVAGTVKAHEERAATLKGFPTNRVLRGFLNVPEGQIHYRYRTPLGNRTPLLMLHGFPSSAWVLQPFVAALGEKRPTYAFDLMGMGDSTGLEMENPGIEDLATAVLHGLDALGIQTCDLYGTLTGAFSKNRAYSRRRRSPSFSTSTCLRWKSTRKAASTCGYSISAATPMSGFRGTVARSRPSATGSTCRAPAIYT
jgi:hypothetical protein